MNRLPLIILAVLVLGSAGFGLAQLDAVQKLKQSMADADRERVALQKRIADLQKRNNELENRHSPAAAVSSVAIPDDEASPGEARRGSTGSPGPRAQNHNDGGRFGAAMASPEIQKLIGLQQRAGLDSRYSSLFKQLQLSPADLEKFKTLLVDKQTAVMDVVAAARAEGMTGRENRDQVRQLVQDAQTEVENNIRATLGEAAYAQYQGFEATQSERAVVSQLEQRLSYSATPLTDSQSQQLVQILASATPTNGNTGQNSARAAGLGGPRGGLGGSAPITSEAITQAQGVLSAQQVAALQGLQQEQQASAQLRQQMRATYQAHAQRSTAVTPGSANIAQPATTPGR